MLEQKRVYDRVLRQSDLLDDLGLLHLPQAAYIKSVNHTKGDGFALCSSNGEELGIFATADIARGIAMRHSLHPNQVH